MSASVAAIIQRELDVLLVKRRPGGDLGNMWELPGGKVDDGEDPPDALRRELNEELGIDGTVGKRAGRATFVHNGVEYTLHGYYVTADLAKLELREHADLTWCTLREALGLGLAPSDRGLINDILGIG